MLLHLYLMFDSNTTAASTNAVIESITCPITGIVYERSSTG